MSKYFWVYMSRVSRVIHFVDESVSVRDLRNHGGEVLDRVARGEVLTVTRDGAEVAELSPKRRRGPSARELIERRRLLPDVDPEILRRDLDDILDAGL